MIRRFALGTMTLLGLAGAAAAADLPTMKAPPPPPPPAVFNWTGFYVGAHVGGAWDGDNWLFSPAQTVTSNHASGVFGGGQVGFNYQISSFVLGAEADASAAGLSSSNLCPNPNFTCGHSIDWLASLRARLGFTPMDRTMIYVTGGAAFADVGHTALPPGVAPFVFTGNYSAESSGMGVGRRT